MRTMTVIWVRCGHSAIVAIVGVVEPAWMGIQRYGCLSVRLNNLTGRGHG